MTTVSDIIVMIINAIIFIDIINKDLIHCFHHKCSYIIIVVIITAFIIDVTFESLSVNVVAFDHPINH